MGEEMKYIIFHNIKNASLVPVIFPEFLLHSTIGEALGGQENVLSAGYVDICDEDIHIDSKRVSCSYPDKKPHPSDESLIKKSITT